jgi:hypothetical protein
MPWPLERRGAGLRPDGRISAGLYSLSNFESFGLAGYGPYRGKSRKYASRFLAAEANHIMLGGEERSI